MTQALERRNETIVGSAEHLAMVLRVSHERGRLLCDPQTIRPYGRADGTWSVTVPMLLPAKPEPRRRVDGDTWSQIGKALAWVAGLLLIGAGFLTLAVLALRSALSDVNWPAVVGVGIIVLMVLIGLTRINHSGACPGIAVHCKGCKH